MALKRIQPATSTIALLIFLSLTGCATGPNGSLVSSIPHPMESSVQTKTDAPIMVRPGGTTVYVNIGDTTGHGVNYTGSVQQGLTALGKGFEITHDPEMADYQIIGKVTQLDYLKEYFRRNPQASNIEFLAAAGTGLGLLASGAGAHTAGTVGLALLAADTLYRIHESATAPECYYAEIFLRVGERNGSFMGQRAKEPIEQWSKETTKITRGKRSHTDVVEMQRLEKDSPVEETVSEVRSGAGSRKIITKREVADFDYHETTFRAVIKVPHGTTIDQAVSQLQGQIGSAIANVL